MRLGTWWISWQRVVDLEQGQAATTHFHTVKPAEIGDSFAHAVSVDMG